MNYRFFLFVSVRSNAKRRRRFLRETVEFLFLRAVVHVCGKFILLPFFLYLNYSIESIFLGHLQKIFFFKVEKLKMNTSRPSLVDFWSLVKQMFAYMATKLNSFSNHKTQANRKLSLKIMFKLNTENWKTKEKI